MQWNANYVEKGCPDNLKYIQSKTKLAHGVLHTTTVSTV